MVRSPLSILWCCGLLIACTRDLSLPLPSTGPKLGAIAPDHGYTGARVVLTGSGFGSEPAQLEVRFGRSNAATPLTAEDGALEVVVPEDATSGKVQVIAHDGRALSSSDFTFDGVGRLRFLRVAAQADLRPVVQSAVMLGTPAGSLVMLEPNYEWTGRTEGLGLRSLDISRSAAIAASADRTVLAVVDLQFEQSCGGAPAVGHLRWSREGTDEGVVCLPGGVAPVLPEEVAVAVDGSGTLALVTYYGTVWLVELKAAGATARKLAGTVLPPVRVAWLGGGRFVLAERTGLRQLNASAPAPELSDPVPVPNGDLGSRGVAAIPFGPSAPAAAGLVAVAGFDGKVDLFDATSWPPVSKGTRDTLVRGELVGGVALASDGTRLAASLTGAGRVVTFDLTDPGAPPFASAQVEQAQELSVAPGLFLAGARGAVAELSWRSGALIASIPITAGLKSPRVRTVQFGAATRPALDVAATTFNALARRDASNLTSPGGLYWLGRLSGPALDQLVTLPGGGAAFLHLDGVGHGALRRSVAGTPLDGEREDEPGGYTFDHDLLQKPRLAASSDGKALFLTLLDSFGAEVRVFSTSGAFKDPKRFGLGKGGVPVLQDGRGHFALLEAAKLQVFDTAQVLAGATAPLVSFDLAGGATAAPNPLAGAGADGRLFLAMPTTDSFAGVSLRIAAPGAGGALSLGDSIRFDRLNPDRQPTFAVALGGRRAYWIEGTGPTQRLVSVPLDLENAEVLDEEQPVPLSGTAAELVLLPDGVHAVVVDPVLDRLTLLE